MSSVDAIAPLLHRLWVGSDVTPMPGLSHEAVTNLCADWLGNLTPEMRQLLQLSCGLSGTPLGSIDFTGHWYAEEPLSIFRPSLTLSIDEMGRRWIAEVNGNCGLPGPVWCVFPQPEVAMYIDATLCDFLLRLHREMRRDTVSEWLTLLNTRARMLWTTRHTRAIALTVAFSRLRELRGWLASLPANAWIYDLRAHQVRRGLPYGLMHERGAASRCGSLPVFAFPGLAAITSAAADDAPSLSATEGYAPNTRH